MTKKEAIDVLALRMPLSAEALKKAYKSAIVRYHPDNCAKENGMFFRVKEAYQYLQEQLQEEAAFQETVPIRACPVCGGSGKRKIKKKTPRGTMVLAADCKSCGGTGSILV